MDKIFCLGHISPIISPTAFAICNWRLGRLLSSLTIAMTPEHPALSHTSNDPDKHEHCAALATKDDETLMQRRPISINRPLSLARVAIVAILTICAVTFFLATYGKGDRAYERSGVGAGSDVSGMSNWPSSHVPQCASTKPMAPVQLFDNLWSMLTVDEAVQIRSWLFDDARGLNLTHGDRAVMKFVNFVISWRCIPFLTPYFVLSPVTTTSS